MDLTLLATFLLAVTLISLVPGPDLLFVLANGLASGPRAGVVAALGMSTGLAVHTVAAALGLGALLQAAPAVLDVVRILGALYLLYLAVATLRASAATPTDEPAPRRSLRRIYLMAVLTNLANPKVVLFYLAFFPQFITKGSGWPATVQFLVLGALFIVAGLAIDASAGVTAGKLSGFLRGRPTVQRWLDRVCAAVFGGLAVRLALDN